MCKRVFSVVLLLALTSVSYGLAISDFETGLGGWEGKEDGWRSGTLSVSATGVTSGAQAMLVEAPGGWQQAAKIGLKPFGAALSNTGASIAAEVTAFPADMTTSWMQVGMVVNAEGAVGWSDLGLKDVALNGEPQTITWAVSDALAANIAAGFQNLGWFELVLVSNCDGASNAKFYVDNIRIIGVPVGPKMIFVTDSQDVDTDTVLDDQGWIDWLKTEYNVDARRNNWQVLDANKIAELNAADIVVLSRGTSTGNYNQTGEPAQWNGLTVPVLNLNLWLARGTTGARFKWCNNPTDVKKDGGSPPMWITDPCQPIFKGLPIDEDGLLEVLDPNAGGGHTSFFGTDFVDPGNGTVLANCLGTYTSAWIMEWQPGVEFYTGAGQIAGGRRMLFTVGSNDGVPGMTVKTPQGAFNLNDNGKHLFRNIVAYMLRPTELAVENASFELPGTTKQNCWDGGTNGKGTFVDVPGWSSDTMATDSGVEQNQNPTDGTWTGFIRSSDPNVWQVTPNIIKAGAVYTLTVDARNTWQSTGLKLMLFYPGDTGRVTVASAELPITDTMQTLSLTFKADDVPASIGKALGIEFDNPSTADAWLGMDNVHLTGQVSL